MPDNLRFTDEWPPVLLWEQYPNWEYALNEEDVEGQDETTLRPAEQGYISEEVACTAADAILASGQRLPALLDVNSRPPDIFRACYRKRRRRRNYKLQCGWSEQESGEV